MNAAESVDAGGGAPPGRRRRLVVALCFLGVLVLHLALLLYFAPPKVVFSREPVMSIDYALHYYQVDRAQRALTGWGRLWSYDPLLLAGQPAGAIEDLSSRTLELFVVGLHKLGVPRGLAFNLYILLVHLLVPFLGYLAARLFELRPLQAVAVALLWVLLWFFDSTLHWFWYCGMISWVAASCLGMVFLGLWYQLIRRRRRWLWWIVIALGAGLPLLHPFAALGLAVLGLPLYLRELRKLPALYHLGLLATLAAAVAANLFWLVPALKLRHYVMDTSSFLRPQLHYLFWDFFDLLKSIVETGYGGVRTFFRFLCLVGALYAFLAWRKEKDPRLLPLGVLVGGALLIAYGGGHLWAVQQVQPYRFVVWAALAAAIPAVVALSGLLVPAKLAALPRHAKLLLVLLVVLALPRLGTHVFYFMPGALPDPPTPPAGTTIPDAHPEPLLGGFGPKPVALAHAGIDPISVKVRDWLVAHASGKGRVLVENWTLGEYLASHTRLPIIGGLYERNVHHMDAHLFRWHRDGNVPVEKLREYFERYAVQYVVVTKFMPLLEWKKTLLQFRVLVNNVRIYETKVPARYFLRGEGRIAAQDLNLIRAEDVRGPEAVLRFHFMETLRCRPGCRVERFPVAGDRVGFIRVPDPPRRFELYNSYEL